MLSTALLALAWFLEWFVVGVAGVGSSLPLGQLVLERLYLGCEAGKFLVL